MGHGSTRGWMDSRRRPGLPRRSRGVPSRGFQSGGGGHLLHVQCSWGVQRRLDSRGRTPSTTVPPSAQPCCGSGVPGRFLEGGALKSRQDTNADPLVGHPSSSSLAMPLPTSPLSWACRPLTVQPWAQPFSTLRMSPAGPRRSLRLSSTLAGPRVLPGCGPATRWKPDAEQAHHWALHVLTCPELALPVSPHTAEYWSLTPDGHQPCLSAPG